MCHCAKGKMLAVRSQRRLHSEPVAYDGTHGFSDQYLVEIPIFLDCVREAGLHTDSRYQCEFLPSELATVSINFLAAHPG